MVTEGMYQGYHPTDDYQSASTAIIFGNSGGPVYWYDSSDNRYEVIGIVLAVSGRGKQVITHMALFRGVPRIHAFLQ